jgi:hypothetical protein
MKLSTVAESTGRHLQALINERIKHIDERLFAARVCAESLLAYDAIHASEPQLRGDALYGAVIARRTHADPTTVHQILWRTHASVEDWDREHEPAFRDVVKYMIVSEYLGQAPGEQGMDIDLGAFLASRIDDQHP